MSKFKKFEARIDKLEHDLQYILDGHSDSGPGSSRSAAVDDGTAAPASGGASRGGESAIDSLAAAVAAIESASQNADALEANVARMDQEVASLRGEMDGYLRRAKETDPDKRVYGEKMTKKVLDADVKFYAVEEHWQAGVDLARAAASRARDEAEAARRRFEESARAAVDSRAKEDEAERERVAREKEAAAKQLEQQQADARAMAAKQADETAARTRARERAAQQEAEDRARRAEEMRRVRNFGQGTEVQRTAAYIAAGGVRSQPHRGGSAAPAQAQAAAPAAAGAGAGGIFTQGSISQINTPQQIQAALDASGSRDGVVVATFSTSWCGPCRRLAPVLVQMAREQPGVVFVKVDGDASPQLVQGYGVSAFPTTLVFGGGKRVAVVRGANQGGIYQAIYQALEAVEAAELEAVLAASKEEDRGDGGAKGGDGDGDGAGAGAGAGAGVGAGAGAGSGGGDEEEDEDDEELAMAIMRSMEEEEDG